MTHNDIRHSDELAHLGTWERTFWLSRSYLEASACLCSAMLEGDFSAQYSSSRVILHLVRQGIELFLKAAIYARGKHPEALGHDLEALCTHYWREYPGQSFLFEIPAHFLVSPTRDLFPEDAAAFRATMDQRHRYAVDRKGVSFASPEEFDPSLVLAEIRELSARLGALEWVQIRPLASA